MANWEYNAMQDLKEYRPIKESLYNIPDRIKTLEAQMTMVRSTRYDKTPVHGGASGYEDALMENIDQRGRLEINLPIVAQKVARIERGLDALDEKEQLVLERFYMDRTRDYLDRLCDELGYEKTHIYRIKDAGLKKFTLAMFGIVDL